MPKISKNLAANLLRARTQRGLSAAAMARYLGVNSPQSYLNYESGRVPRDKNILQRFAELLGCAMDDLLANPDATAHIQREPSVAREPQAAYTASVSKHPLSMFNEKTLKAFLTCAMDQGDFAAAAIIFRELETRNGKGGGK